jgi:hypothetical protein
MGFTVFLGNLPPWVAAEDIESWLASENLAADSIKVIRDHETQESKGFALLKLRTPMRWRRSFGALTGRRWKTACSEPILRNRSAPRVGLLRQDQNVDSDSCGGFTTDRRSSVNSGPLISRGTTPQIVTGSVLLTPARNDRNGTATIDVVIYVTDALDDLKLIGDFSNQPHGWQVMKPTVNRHPWNVSRVGN